jgi:hypothetical protein
MAAAVETQVIAITLGSALGSETAPYGEGHWVIEPRLDCYPCSAEKACAAQICAESITTECVTELALHSLEKSRIVSAAMNDSSIRLYRTEMDKQYGQLRLIRYGENAEDERDKFNNLFRALWPRWLNKTCDSRLDIPEVNHQFKMIAAAAIQEANIAEKLCFEIADQKQNSKKEFRKIERLVAHLTLVELKLSRTLQSADVLKSVLAYMMIEKGSVGGDTLKEQARQTAKVYHDLIHMLEAVVPRQMKHVDSINNNKEVCHENLA